MKAYIGVDPSITNTGLVLLSENGRLKGYANGKNGTREKNAPMRGIARYVSQAEYLARHFAVCEIIGMAYEGYSFQSTHQGYSLAEFGGILKAKILEYYHRELLYVAPMRLKKFATGNGHADKKMMMERAFLECADLPENAGSDICDAYFLAKYAFYKNNPELAAIVDRGNPHLRTRLEIVLEK